MLDPTTRIVIPDNVSFADLRLSYGSDTRNLTFQYRPFLEVCFASGIDPTALEPHDVRVLLCGWYAHAHQTHGETNESAEVLIAVMEAQASRQAGQRPH